mgnify:CR=1 FL=1
MKFIQPLRLRALKRKRRVSVYLSRGKGHCEPKNNCEGCCETCTKEICNLHERVLLLENMYFKQKKQLLMEEIAEDLRF